MATTTTIAPVAKIFDSKPKAGELAPGQVGQYTVNGKVTYIVGNTGGRLTNPTTSVTELNKKINVVATNVETIQIQNLKDENTITVKELGDTLKAEGLSTKEINAAVKAEKAANTAEVNLAIGLLKPVGYQTLEKTGAGLLTAVETPPDTSTGFVIPVNFNTTTSTTDGTTSTTWNSLNYSGVGADKVIQNINTTFDQVSELKVKQGLTQDVYQQTSNEDINKTTGFSDAALYDAISSGAIYKNDAGQFAVDKTVPMFADINTNSTSAEKSLFYNIDAMLDRGLNVGDTVKTTIDTDGNLKIQGGGTYSDSLVDTGQKDAAGNPIYTQTTTRDEKYIDLNVTSVYVKNPDGTFTYMGSPSPGTVHDAREGFNFGEFALKAGLGVAAFSLGMPFIADKIVAPMLQGTSLAGNAVAANAIAGALAGGAVGGVTGVGALKGALTGGIGAAVGTVVTDLLKQYGGWTGLANASYEDVAQFAKSLATETASTANIELGVDAAGNIVDVATNTALTPMEGMVFNPETNNLLNPDYYTSMGADPQLIPGLGDANLLGVMPSAETKVLDDYLKLNPDYVATPPPAQETFPPNSYAPGSIETEMTYNPNTGTYLNPEYYENVLAVDPVLKNTGGAVNLDTRTVFDDLAQGAQDAIGSLTDTIAENPWTAATVATGAASGLLTPPQAPEGAKWTPFPATTIDYGSTGNYVPLATPNWWNNLYNRGGYGAGQYLGYDILRNMNIPADIQGLLNGQNPTSATPA